MESCRARFRCIDFYPSQVQLTGVEPCCSSNRLAAEKGRDPIKAGSSAVARLAESGEGCVEASQNLSVALPAPVVASLPSTICWAKRPHAKKTTGWGSW